MRSTLMTGLMVVGIALIAPRADAGVGTSVNTFKITPAVQITHAGQPRSATLLEVGRDTVTFSGDTTYREATPAIADTSVVYDSRYWETLTFQSKFTPRVADASAGDSAGVKIYLEQSNDGENFVVVDSVSSTDTSWTYKNMAVQHWAFSRVRVIHQATMDSAGAWGQIIAHSWGRF